MWDNYLGGMEMRRSDNVSPYAAPARAEDLAGLPPTYRLRATSGGLIFCSNS
ncbi:hypothetical protein [Streptomyces sp. NBC_01483]|uniref:hypothetical protein n=1 Tax=Streptomyces sp. NBC_01483 TaxID=2903883 RepID=UPI002E30FD08|nr:hypothetical protein [Streptomyces sp. NBC_01483]